MNALFSEIDRLTTAWEAVNKELKNQVISIEKWEEDKEKLIIAVSPRHIDEIEFNIDFRLETKIR